MIDRAKKTLYLAPALTLLFVWIAAAPGLAASYSPSRVVVLAILSALVSAWCISLFAHSLITKE